MKNFINELELYETYELKLYYLLKRKNILFLFYANIFIYDAFILILNVFVLLLFIDIKTICY